MNGIENPSPPKIEQLKIVIQKLDALIDFRYQILNLKPSSEEYENIFIGGKEIKVKKGNSIKNQKKNIGNMIEAIDYQIEIHKNMISNL